MKMQGQSPICDSCGAIILYFVAFASVSSPFNAFQIIIIKLIMHLICIFNLFVHILKESFIFTITVIYSDCKKQSLNFQFFQQSVFQTIITLMEAVNNKRDQGEFSSYTTKKKSLSYNSLKRNRAFRSEKKSQEKDRSSSKRQQMRQQLQAFIALIPADEALIEDYICELKRKLEVVKSTKNMKIALPHDQQALKFRQKIKKDERERSPPNSQIKKRNQNKWKLFEEIRSNAKRQKLRSPDYRTPYHKIEININKSSTFKRFQPKSIRLTQMEEQVFPRTRSDVKQRWNTQEVIKAGKPARVYRYQAASKPTIQRPRPRPMACSLNMKNGGSTRNTSYVFDKIVNVNHNINIYSSCQKQRNRKCRFQDQNQEKYQSIAKGEAYMKNNKQNVQQNNSNQKELQSNSKEVPLSNSKQLNQIPILNNNDEHRERIEDISTIEAKKQTLQLLGESCSAIKEGLSSEKKVNEILDFLGWKTEELKQVFQNGKQKKRKYQLDKLSRMFPKGFFP